MLAEVSSLVIIMSQDISNSHVTCSNALCELRIVAGRFGGTQSKLPCSGARTRASSQQYCMAISPDPGTDLS
jgi:hypothetical protein